MDAFFGAGNEAVVLGFQRRGDFQVETEAQVGGRGCDNSRGEVAAVRDRANIARGPEGASVLGAEDGLVWAAELTQGDARDVTPGAELTLAGLPSP